MLGVVFYSPAINGQGAVHVKSIAAKHAIRDGMGAGEFSGQYSNLRALVYVFGPLYMSRIYSFQAARGGNPGLAYLVASILGYALPFVLHLTWKARDMYPWEYSQQDGEKKAVA